MMRNLLDTLRRWLGLRPAAPSFHGGAALPPHKALSAINPSREALLVPRYYLDLLGPRRREALLQVAVGDYVRRGQLLTLPADPAGVAQHAPTSGVVTGLVKYPALGIAGWHTPHLEITADGRDEGEALPPLDWQNADREILLERIAHCGISGLGGAGFPTARKLRGTATTLVVNMAECEPYLTCDDVQIREQCPAILSGAAIAARLCGAERVVFGIEDDKPAAIAELRAQLAAQNRPDWTMQVVPARYPSGNSRQLFELLFGLRIPADGHASHYGYLCHNSGTLKAVHDAVVLGEPLIERYTTISGEGVRHPAVLRARIGTPLSALLQQCGGAVGLNRAIIGGPMMGFEQADLRAALTKSANGLLLLPRQETAAEEACIRCAQCADACPMELLPQQLYWYSRADDHQKLRQYRLDDCIECGLCAAVCPSHIPLVRYYRDSKERLREETTKAELAAHARQRHEARQQRLEREARQREEKMAARGARAGVAHPESSPAAPREPAPPTVPGAPLSPPATLKPTAPPVPSFDPTVSLNPTETRATIKPQTPAGPGFDPSATLKPTEPRATLKPMAPMVPSFDPTAAAGADKSAAIAAATARAQQRRAERLAATSPAPNTNGDAEARRQQRRDAARAQAEGSASLAEANPLEQGERFVSQTGGSASAPANALAESSDRSASSLIQPTEPSASLERSASVVAAPSPTDKLAAAKQKAAERRAQRLANKEGSASAPANDLNESAEGSASPSANALAESSDRSASFGTNPPEQGERFAAKPEGSASPSTTVLNESADGSASSLIQPPEPSASPERSASVAADKLASAKQKAAERRAQRLTNKEGSASVGANPPEQGERFAAKPEGSASPSAQPTEPNASPERSASLGTNPSEEGERFASQTGGSASIVAAPNPPGKLANAKQKAAERRAQRLASKEGSASAAEANSPNRSASLSAPNPPDKLASAKQKAAERRAQRLANKEGSASFGTNPPEQGERFAAKPDGSASPLIQPTEPSASPDRSASAGTHPSEPEERGPAGRSASPPGECP